jgi:hypothetical protein
MAQWYFASFWLIVFTGAIRKWLKPGVTVLYLLQDVTSGLAYLYVIWKGFFDRGYMLLAIIVPSTVNLCHLISGSRSAIALARASIFGATHLISPTEFNTVSERFTGARYQQDNQDRLLGGLIGFTTILKLDMLGAGLGMGVAAAHVGNEYTYCSTYDLIRRRHHPQRHEAWHAGRIALCADVHRFSRRHDFCLHPHYVERIHSACLATGFLSSGAGLSGRPDARCNHDCISGDDRLRVHSGCLLLSGQSQPGTRG